LVSVDVGLPTTSVGVDPMALFTDATSPALSKWVAYKPQKSNVQYCTMRTSQLDMAWVSDDEETLCVGPKRGASVMPASRMIYLTEIDDALECLWLVFLATR
jgi:hypothetical protein